MDRDFKYRLLAAPEKSLDGSGIVYHQITAICREAGSSDSWETVPERNKSFCVPAAELATVMDMPDGTGAEKQAKNQAYKDALVANINTWPVAIIGWTGAALEAMMDANDAAATEAARANEYVTVTLGLDYPVDFSL